MRQSFTTRRILLFILINVTFIVGLSLWNRQRHHESVQLAVAKSKQMLDMPAEAAAARIDRQLDRMEAKGLDYLRAVREGFLTESRLDPERLVLIDAQGTREEVRDRILEAAIAHGL